MKKKNNELRRRLTAMALAAVMCIGTAQSVFAVDPISGGTEADPATATITKKLDMPEGTTTPGATFSFQLSPVSVDDRTGTTDLASMPAISPVNIAFTSGDTGTVSNGTKTILKQSGNVFSGVTFPHAGVYVYGVEESQSVTGYTPGSNETYTYSPANYTITVYVKNSSSGLYIAAIASTIAAIDNGSQAVNVKVDPTPSNPDGYSKMIFTNTYSKTAGGVDPTDPDNHVLTVSKEVSGDYADKTKYFEFKVTATRPGVVSGASTYMAYVLSSSNQVVTSAENVANVPVPLDGSIEFTSGTEKTVFLKHGQKLVFTDLHIGAKYIAVESAVEHYKPSAKVVENGGSTINLSQASDNTPLSTTDRIIGENQNSAAFTNNYRTITPTGVIINNLPFIMILILAAGAFAAFVVVKSHKKRGSASFR